METRQVERIGGCDGKAPAGENPWHTRVRRLEAENAELRARLERIEAALTLAAAAMEVAADRPTA